MTKRQRFLVFCLWTLMLIGLSQIGSLASQALVKIEINVVSADISGFVKNSSGVEVIKFSGVGTSREENLPAGDYSIEWTGGMSQSGYEVVTISIGTYSCTLM